MADGLAVDIAQTDDDDEQYVQVEVVQVGASDDADIRQNMGLNSPKGKGDYQDNDVGGGMSLSLADASDDDDDEGGVTPNTKVRDQMGINSPRNKGKGTWKNSEEESNAAVQALMTQVQRPDKQSGGGAESLVTQVARPDEDDTESKINQVTTAPNSGFCSCLWNCCSGPQPPEAVPMKSTSQQRDDMNSYQNASDKRSDGDGGMKTTQSKQASLINNNYNNDDQKEESVSSSTEYGVSLLPDLIPSYRGKKKCLVLDLDETLVHSSFKPIPKPDFIIPVEIDRVVHHVYVLKRPYVDEFLLRTSKCYEIVIFTASLSKYADPLLDKLDIHNVIEHRLFRESCVIHGTAYVKDLRKIGRKLKTSIIVDNSPPSYLFQPTNAVPITSWFDDQTDTQLLDFCPVLETTLNDIDDVRKILDANNKSFRWLCNQAHQPLSKYPTRNVNPHKY